MPLQNRVTPFGDIVTSPARGILMGNRGILHDETQTVLRTHAHQNWVTCTLSFNGRKRPLMAPGKYTELFFLDEATALAAGHRPCAECRRDRYRAFTTIWQSVHGAPEEGRSLPQTIDRALHRARIHRRTKVTHQADAQRLPDGTLIDTDGTPLLLWQGHAYRWSFDGYTPHGPAPEGMVTVLTPAPTVEVLRAGYVPEMHPSLAQAALGVSGST